MSKLGEAIGLKHSPVAVLKQAQVPEGALKFRGRGCVVALLSAAAKGRVGAVTKEAIGCLGGRSGLGFEKLSPEPLVHFLAEGTASHPGLRQKKDAATAAAYVSSLPVTQPAEVVVFCPLDQLPQGAVPVSVIFLVNPDQLSALVTLANYDKPTQDNVQVRFAAGCAQAVLLSMCDSEAGADRCIIGLTDPSARLHVDKDLLSFSLPYARFLELEEQVDASFLTTETWQRLRKRI